MFCLRRFTEDQNGEYKNVKVGDFITSQKQNCWQIAFEPPLPCMKQELYQVYPGERERTFYNLEHGKVLFAFVKHKVDGKLELVGQTKHADQYLYFAMVHGKHDGCVLVVADGEGEDAGGALNGKSFNQ